MGYKPKGTAWQKEENLKKDFANIVN